MIRWQVACGLLVVLALFARVAGAAPASVVVSGRAIAPGELVVLTITTAAPAVRMPVRAFDRDVPVWRESQLVWRALVGIDLDVAPGHRVVDVAPGTDDATTCQLDVRPRRFPTRRLRVDEAFVNPPPKVQERIRREADELARLWTTPSAERLWEGPFSAPVSDPANSRFGTRSVFNGQPRNPHTGADFLSAAGTPVTSPAGGRVALARELYMSGNTVVIDHGLGVFSLLAHLSSFEVGEGDLVAAGKRVGRVGATGRVTGPHLHWAVRINGSRVDPVSVLAALGR